LTVTFTKARGRRTRRPGLGEIVGLTLCALVLISGGAFMWWHTHSGVPSRATIVECQQAGKSVNCTALWPPSSTPEELIPYDGGKWTDVGHDIDVIQDGRSVRVTVVECHVAGESLGCTGVSPPSTTPLQTVPVQGADWGDVGHDIDVHVHNGQSVNRRSFSADKDHTGVAMLAAGCGALVWATVSALRRRRKPDPQDAWSAWTAANAAPALGITPSSALTAPPPTTILPSEFVASAQSVSNTAMAVVVYGGIALLMAGFWFGHHLGLNGRTVWLAGLVVALAVPAVGIYVRNHPATVRIRLTDHDLTVVRRKAEVFPYVGAQLGQWVVPMYGTTLGTALHLRNGRRHFVLGGEDHRVTGGTHLDAKPTRTVNAQLPASDFDALLTRVAPAGGLDVRRAAPGEPIRCLLLPNAARFFSTARLGMTQTPRLAIDVGADSVWVMDLYRNAPIASAWRAQVTATPAIHPSHGRGDIAMPALVVSLPGQDPLIIGHPDRRRFSWPGAVGEVPQPDYVVSGADWMSLVETFGLASYLENRR
jgi:hypothetical protein